MQIKNHNGVPFIHIKLAKIKKADNNRCLRAMEKLEPSDIVGSIVKCSKKVLTAFSKG
jgi:hypothetical protein